MRLLRQISLDGNILRQSSFSKSPMDLADRLGQNFARHLTDTIHVAICLLEELKNGDSNSKVGAERNGNSKKDKSSEIMTNNILKVLEELNSLIVYLIRISSDKDLPHRKSTDSKPKSKIRRQYSAFVESNQFRRIRRSLSRQDSDSSLNGGSPSSSPPKSGDSPLSLDDSQSLIPICGCSLEEAVCKLIDSQILTLLVESISNVGFEEKKMVRIILTNSMILEVNKCHLVVEYLTDTSNGILKSLVQNYEIGRSDVTLNCGSILRFASQYQPIVAAILQSDFFYNFFEYMQRSPASFPFDVAMDVFYTFKTILTRHKSTTIDILQSNPTPFFDAFIQLLRHADITENYVTKRQTLEIFADIFSGAECSALRAQFVVQNCYICPVIVYLWNRNLQIRLRCLVLLNQLFRVDSNSKDGESVPATTSDIENCSSSESNSDSNSDRSRSNSKEIEPLQRDEWQFKLLLDKIRLAQVEYSKSNTKFGPKCDTEVAQWMRNMFVELRSECSKSSIKHFTSQIPFTDQVINAINLM